MDRFPGQESIGGDSRIPSLMYYDKTGSLRAVGAETQQKHNVELAANERWTRLEWCGYLQSVAFVIDVRHRVAGGSSTFVQNILKHLTSRMPIFPRSLRARRLSKF